MWNRIGVVFLSLALLALSSFNASIRPLVLWHGLGDTHSSPGILEFQTLIKKIHPGIFIHSVYVEQDPDKDRKAGYYGNINLQVESVAQQLAVIPELAAGFDALGLSQGGQFLRAYVEWHNSPPVHNLITFGSQHMGISSIGLCQRYDILCNIARRAAKGAVYSAWAQENLVQAQYFRDPAQLSTYLTANHFLTSINNELPEKNSTFKKNLASLDNFVLILFTEDQTVVPKETSWFGSERSPEDTAALGRQAVFSPDNIIPLRDHPIYTEDWIGLRELDKTGRLVFESCEGKHMHMGDCWQPIVERFCGGEL